MKTKLVLTEKQMEMYRSSTRNFGTVAVLGRRAGKSTAMRTLAMLMALNYQWKGVAEDGVRPIVLLLGPTIKQAKPVLFQPLLAELKDIYHIYDRCTINKSDMTIDIPGHPLIQISGLSDGGDRLRGGRVLAAIIDEAQDCNLNTIQSVIWPALADTEGSRIIYGGTPKGKQNTLYKLTQLPQHETIQAPSISNTLLGPHFKANILALKDSLPENIYAQEFGAEFVAPSQRFFSSYSEDVHLIEKLPQKQAYYVFVGYDPGPRNAGYAIIALGGDQVFYILEAKNLGDANSTLNANRVQSEIKARADKWCQTLKATTHTNNLWFVDPSRPDLIDDLKYLGAQPAYNSFDSGVQWLDIMFCRGSIKLLKGPHNQLPELLPEYVRKVDKSGNTTDKEDDNIETHCIDALRYGIASYNHMRKQRWTRTL